MAINWQTEYHRYRRYFVNLSQFYRHKKVRVYTQIVLSILTVAFFLVFAIKPTVVTVTGLIKQINDQQMVVKKLEEKVNALALAQKQYLQVQPELYLINQALPKNPEVSSLVKQLETLVRQSGAVLEAIQFSQVDLKGEVQTKQEAVNFNLVISGDYQQLKSFLRSLTVFRRVILIEGFAFRFGKAETQALALSLNGKAYFLGEEQ